MLTAHALYRSAGKLPCCAYAGPEAIVNVAAARIRKVVRFMDRPRGPDGRRPGISLTKSGVHRTAAGPPPSKDEQENLGREERPYNGTLVACRRGRRRRPYAG